MSALPAAVVLGLALAAGPSPEPSPTPRPKREKARAFTDADLERYRAERDAERAKAPSSPSSDTPADDGQVGYSSESESNPQASPADAVRDARAALSNAEATRDQARAQVQSIESRLNPMSTEFETDPNVIMGLQSELPAARAALDESEAAVTAARAQLEAAEDQARRAGVALPPSDR